MPNKKKNQNLDPELYDNTENSQIFLYERTKNYKLLLNIPFNRSRCHRIILSLERLL